MCIVVKYGVEGYWLLWILIIKVDVPFLFQKVCITPIGLSIRKILKCALRSESNLRPFL